MNPFLIFLIVLVVVGGFFVVLYNKLVTLRLRVKEAWSDIDVQLKRRNSLIPNLVNSVKGYMTHEKDLLEKVTKLRSQVEQAESPKELGELSNELSSAIKGINIAVENYPDLKANTNVIKLQEELTATEDKISYSRRFYNQSVLALNTAIQRFPAVLFAGLLGFKQEEFFEANEEERADIEVDLSTDSESKSSK
jgi:LemA protein